MPDLTTDGPRSAAQVERLARLTPDQLQIPDRVVSRHLPLLRRARLDPDSAYEAAWEGLLAGCRTFDPGRQPDGEGGLDRYLVYCCFETLRLALWPRSLKERARRRALSLGVSHADDGFNPVAAALCAHDPGPAQVDALDQVERWLRLLPDNYAVVCRLVWLDGLTNAEAGAHLGVTREAIRQTLSRAAAKLRSHLAGTAPA